MSANSYLLGDRIKDTASSVNSTTVTLNNSAPTGFQTFGSFYANADIAPCYLISDGTNWELSGGAYTSSGTTLVRAATPRASSNSGSQVASFSGTITVACVDDAAFTNTALPGLATGQLWPMYGLGTVLATGSKVTGTVLYMPVYIGQWFSSVNIHMSVNAIFAGTSTTSLGLYSNLNGAPNARLGQATGINTGTAGATGDVASGSIALGEMMPPGLYWVGFVSTTNAFTANVFAGSATIPYIGARPVLGLTSMSTTNATALNMAWSQTSATLPTNASSLSLFANSVPIVGVAAS